MTNKVLFDKLLSDYQTSVHIEKEQIEFNRISRLKAIEEKRNLRIKNILTESKKKHERT